MDRKAFQLWSFSLRSLTRAYGHAFLKEIVLRHPLRTLKGIWAYSHPGNQIQREGDITYLIKETTGDFIQKAAEGAGDFLIGLGFCQKPIMEEGSGGCPSGRFTHDCFYLDRLNLMARPGTATVPHPACQGCTIRSSAPWPWRPGLIFTS